MTMIVELESTRPHVHSWLRIHGKNELRDATAESTKESMGPLRMMFFLLKLHSIRAFFIRTLFPVYTGDWHFLHDMTNYGLAKKVEIAILFQIYAYLVAGTAA